MLRRSVAVKCQTECCCLQLWASMYMLVRGGFVIAAFIRRVCVYTVVFCAYCCFSTWSSFPWALFAVCFAIFFYGFSVLKLSNQISSVQHERRWLDGQRESTEWKSDRRQKWWRWNRDRETEQQSNRAQSKEGEKNMKRRNIVLNCTQRTISFGIVLFCTMCTQATHSDR